MNGGDSEPPRPASADAARIGPNDAQRGLSTSLIAHPYEPPAGFEGMQPPTYKASTVYFKTPATMRARSWKEKTGYTYGLHGTPTSFTLEERLATLEGGVQTLLVPSGLAAVSMVDIALLKSGDHVLIPANAYAPGKELARAELAGWGITHAIYDPMAPASLEAAITPATRLVWLEAPGSVTMEFPDIAALTAIAHANGALVVLDNTWGAGIAFDPFRIGADGGASVAVDISIQALTKYVAGSGDLLMGSVTTRDEALHQRLKMSHMRLGWGVSGADIEQVLRALPSLTIRYAAQEQAGLALAAWWARRPEVAQLLHPAFRGSPGHDTWRRTCSHSAGLFSVVFDARFGPAAVDAFIEALQLFRIGFSWAGPVSLAVPYNLAQMREEPAWRGTLVRFSMGLEDVADLIADCEQAMARTLGMG